MNKTTQTKSDDVGRGAWLGIAMNVIYVGLWYAWSIGALKGLLPEHSADDFWISLYSIIFIGVTQLIYVLPAIAYFHLRKRPGMVKGLVIAAALVALLNGLCWAKLKS